MTSEIHPGFSPVLSGLRRKSNVSSNVFKCVMNSEIRLQWEVIPFSNFLDVPRRLNI